jgi:hypothetical protein
LAGWLFQRHFKHSAQSCDFCEVRPPGTQGSRVQQKGKLTSVPIFYGGGRSVKLERDDDVRISMVLEDPVRATAKITHELLSVSDCDFARPAKQGKVGREFPVSPACAS